MGPNYRFVLQYLLSPPSSFRSSPSGFKSCPITFSPWPQWLLQGLGTWPQPGQSESFPGIFQLELCSFLVKLLKDCEKRVSGIHGSPFMEKPQMQTSRDKRQEENPGLENIQVPDSTAENTRVPIIPKAVLLCCLQFSELLQHPFTAFAEAILHSCLPLAMKRVLIYILSCYLILFSLNCIHHGQFPC